MATIQAKPDRQMLLQWLHRTNTQWIWEKIAELKEKDTDIIQGYSMTPDELRKELLEGINDLKEGRSISMEDLIKESETW
jgi:hypothetical protein